MGEEFCTLSISLDVTLWAVRDKNLESSPIKVIKSSLKV